MGRMVGEVGVDRMLVVEFRLLFAVVEAARLGVLRENWRLWDALRACEGLDRADRLVLVRDLCIWLWLCYRALGGGRRVLCSTIASG